jgi:hypothetical protein
LRNSTDILFLLILFGLAVPCLTEGRQADDSILDEIQIFRDFGYYNQDYFETEIRSDYPYEYLKRKASVEFEERDGRIVAYIHHRNVIRIHSDDPIEQVQASMVGIPYYAAENMEQVTNLEGITWKPGGSFHRIDQGSVQNSQLNSRYRLIEFEMPEVDQGDVIEYKYTLVRRYIEELPGFYFSDQVPVRKATLYIKNEPFIRYNAVTQNIDFELQYEEFEVDTSSVPHVFTYERPDPVYIEKWSAADVDGIGSSAYISSPEDIRAQINFQLSEFGLPRQPLENSWEYVAAQIRRHNNPYKLVDQNREHFKEVFSGFSPLDSPEEMQDSIFAYVNRQSQFNEVNAIFTTGSLEHVLKGVPADQAEINTVLLGLLLESGIEAWPLYVSSRSLGRINRTFPSLYQFNRVLVVSKISGEQFLMDASFPHSYPGLIPVDAFNEQGMVFKKDGYEWMDLTPARSVFNLDIDVSGKLQADGTLSGKLQVKAAGYPAREIARALDQGGRGDDIVRETFFDVYPEVNIEGLEIRQNRSEAVYLDLSFVIENYAVSFAEGLEYRPMLIGYLFQNPFEETSRRVPITLDAPEIVTVQYSIELPDGVSSETVSGEQQTRLNGAELSEEYQLGESRLDYFFQVEITRKEFLPEEFSQLRQIYQRWVELSNEVWFIEIENGM